MIFRTCRRALVAVSLTAAAVAADDLCPVTRHPIAPHEPVTLVRGGVPAAVIVAPEKPGPLLARAIQDLQSHVRKASGATLPIAAVPADGLATVTVAVVGADDPDLFPKPVGVEGFAVKTGPGSVTLAGRDEAGAAWAIYDFLERSIGVRWYWPEERPGQGREQEWIGTHVPPADTLSVEAAHWTDAPVFRKRTIWPSGGDRIGTADVDALHRRLRSNDSWPVQIIVHAPQKWGTLYKDSRPEIFQLRTDGQRDFDMLCYGSPATLQTYLEQIELQRDKRAEPGLEILSGEAVTVSPADMTVACSCKDCQAAWNPAGGTYGSASKLVATFVAKLAREVKARWPDLTVVYLPYKNYTSCPEGVIFPDNVEVQLCGMPGLALHKEPAIDAAEQANIDAWSTLSGRPIQNWHYSCWPEDRTRAAYLFPHVISAHYRANRGKTVGSFINGVENHWPRQHLSLYVWMKSLWNPDFDPDAAIEGFVSRMYGPAAEPMRTLVRMQIAGWEESRWPDASFSPRTVYEISYPRADVQRMESLLAEAFAAAKRDPLVTARLAYAAGPLRAFFQQSAEHASGAGLQTLSLVQAATDPVIDGKLDDREWTGVDPLPFVRATDREHPQPSFPTTVRAVWTRRGVTFGFQMSEPTPAKLARSIGADSRDSSLAWWDDNVELFLDVSGEGLDFYQFIVTANGAVADFRGEDAAWNAADLKVAAFVGPDFWSAEVFVPYSAFPPGRAPGTGVSWRGNFTRHRVTDRSDREYQRLNTRYAEPSNDQNAFGQLPFVER